MKKYLFLFFIAVLPLNIYAQSDISFSEQKINKKVSEFSNLFNLNTPLNSYVSLYYIFADGKESLLRLVSSESIKYFLPDSLAPDVKISEKEKSFYMNNYIERIIIYKDSIAYVISNNDTTKHYIRVFYKENNKWVSVGEDARRSDVLCKEYIYSRVNEDIRKLQKISLLIPVPVDTLAFVKYIQVKGQDPSAYLLDKLASYRLVLYGEIHRRRSSWDLLIQLLNRPEFAKHTGTIFMELPSNNQKDIDNFLNGKNSNDELLLKTFRNFTDVGWNDKGMFDFIMAVRKRNGQLPPQKRIRIIAADISRPWDKIKTQEDYINYFSKQNRDSFMASIILRTLIKKTDKRNAVFIVGTGHVCKSLESTGSILSKKLQGSCFSIFQHSLQMDNIVDMSERLRHGVFDYAFYKNGYLPVAFDLENSPFGQEPFDGLYLNGKGTYCQNYDGYIFFKQLEKEEKTDILFKLYSDVFIKEIDRRKKLQGSSLKGEWNVPSLDLKVIINYISSNFKLSMWEGLK